jgi:biotin transport system substrate-specific component
MRTTLATTATSAPEGILHQSFGASRSAFRQFAMIVAATGFVALCAHVSLPLPFTVVPLTLQTFAVVLLGMVMGPTAAFAALTLYLVEGAAGLPVFSQYGPGGLAKLLGPTGGYLFSYPLAAALAGGIVRRFTLVQSRSIRSMAAGAAAVLLILTMGTAWLAVALHLHSGAALAMGVVPFLPGEAIKVIAAGGIFATLERWKRA